MSFNINVYDEWSTLKTMILGDVIPCDVLPPERLWDDPVEQDNYRRIIDETKEDLAAFEAIMTSRGINVLRPDVTFWNEGEGHPINARDFYFAYGNQGLTTRGSIRHREPLHFNHIVTEALRSGYLWASFPYFDSTAPKSDVPDADYIRRLMAHECFADTMAKEDPAMVADFKAAVFRGDYVAALDALGRSNAFWPGSEQHTYNKSFHQFALFHAAGMMRYGKHIMIGEAGSTLGRRFLELWVRQQGGELLPILRGGHIDGGMAFLREDTMLGGHGGFPAALRAKVPNCIVPQKENTFWDRVHQHPDRWTLRVPSRWVDEWQGFYQQFNADRNAVSLDRNTVCLSFFDGETYKALERIGIEPVYVQWRHRVFWAGGLHCITLDLERDGEQVDYLR